MTKARRVRKLGLAELQQAQGGLVFSNARLASLNKAYDPNASTYAPTLTAPVAAVPQLASVVMAAPATLALGWTMTLPPTAALELPLPPLPALPSVSSLLDSSYSDSGISMMAMSMVPSLIDRLISLGGGTSVGGGYAPAASASRYARSADPNVDDYVDEDDYEDVDVDEDG